MPIPKDISQHYGLLPEAYWTAEALDTDIKSFYPLIDKFIELYKRDNKGLRALDIGAGLGKFMKALESRSITAYGLEPSEQFYDRAINVTGVNPSLLTLSSIEEANYPENGFDFISFGAVFEHLYNPHAALLSALKWLKHDGLIHIEVPNADWLTSKLINFAYRCQGLDYACNISPMHSPFHLYEFTRRCFEYNAEKEGFRIAFSKIHPQSTHLPRILDPVLKPMMALTNSGNVLEIWLQKNAN